MCEFKKKAKIQIIQIKNNLIYQQKCGWLHKIGLDLDANNLVFFRMDLDVPSRPKYLGWRKI